MGGFQLPNETPPPTITPVARDSMIAVNPTFGEYMSVGSLAHINLSSFAEILMFSSSSAPTNLNNSLLHLPLMPRCSKSRHYIFGLSISPSFKMCASCENPAAVSSCLISHGKIWAFPLPAKVSDPILIWDPSPTFHARPCFMISIECVMAFQMIETRMGLWLGL